jgi:Helicase associated domain
MTNKSSWHANLEALREFIETSGRYPKAHENHGGLAVGQWLYRQRRSFRQSTLFDGRRQRLEEEWPGILADAPAPEQKIQGTRHEQWWNQCFSALLAFTEQQGRLPRQSEKYEDIYLGQWLKTQLRAHSAGVLLPARQKALRLAWPAIFEADHFGRSHGNRPTPAEYE